MRIALINPITRRTQGYHTIGSFIPQLGLQVLAELVPAEHEVDIYDECFSPVSVSEHIAPRGYDLVGVTSYTSGATRAYEIAADCRKLGIPTIIGGPHASACPEEAAQPFDAVAVGEGDHPWPEVVGHAPGHEAGACSCAATRTDKVTIQSLSRTHLNHTVRERASRTAPRALMSNSIINSAHGRTG